MLSEYQVTYGEPCTLLEIHWTGTKPKNCCCYFIGFPFLESNRSLRSKHPLRETDRLSNVSDQLTLVQTMLRFSRASLLSFIRSLRIPLPAAVEPWFWSRHGT